MSRGRAMTDDRDYEVGYGKPPKHSQFVPGQSGFKGRRKAKETPAEIVRRVRDELVMFQGNMVTKLELAVLSVMNQTIKGGRFRDLRLLFDFLDKHGALPKADEAAKSKAAADKVMAKIEDIFNKTLDIDPEDAAALEKLQREEAQIVMNCRHCGPSLRARWADQAYLALRKRYGGTGLHDLFVRGLVVRKTPKSD